MQTTRRQFLASSAVAGGTMLGLTEGLGFLSRLPSVSAAEAKLEPSLVRLDRSIEPVVKLLEDTPREKLLEEVAQRVRDGKVSYREVLAGLMLAGVRNVQPRPSVGFKFHAVLVVNSAHLASLASPDSDRWLPIFWSLDQFKSAQAATKKESGWRMQPVDEKAVPPAGKAREAFIEAMNKWDEPAADAAAAGLARACGMNEAFELFARFGQRDFRDIGHKAIYVSNSFRTLQCIGWQHAEPVLRSLAYALMKYDGKNPAESDQDADRPGRRNATLAEKIPANWNEGKPDDGAAKELLGTLRTGSDEDASKLVAEFLEKGIAAQSAWDAIFSAAGEQVMRRPNIVSIHAVTSSNALRYAFDSTGNDKDRRMLLLQAAAFFVTLFRGARGGVQGGVKVDEFEPKQPTASLDDPKADATGEIFADAGRDRMTAAAKTLAYLKGGASPEALITAARRLVFLKGNDSHDYKFSSAVLEDYYKLSPAWRDRYLASSMFLLPTAAEKDNALVQRTRAALGA